MSKILQTDKKNKYKGWDGVDRTSTGCMGLDMLCDFMDKARFNRIPLRSITLVPSLYDKIDDHCRKHYITDEELQDETIEVRRFMLDGVPINRAVILQLQPMVWEVFNTERNEEDLFINRKQVDFSGLDNRILDPEVKTTITKS